MVDHWFRREKSGQRNFAAQTARLPTSTACFLVSAGFKLDSHATMSSKLQLTQKTNGTSQPGGDVQPKKKTFAESDFEFGKNRLGQGRFGSVFPAREKKNNFPVAIKVMFKNMLTNDQTLLQLKREIELQYYLLHKNILTLYGFFDDHDHVYIVLELCQLGSLFKVIKKYVKLTLHRATYVIDCMADALNYCHARHVIHRDIKPENVLLTEKFVPKLADFGWAVHAVSSSRQTLCGTPDYLSPEMLNTDNNHSHTYKIDNWAIGVLYYECLTGQTPFYSKDQTMTFRNIQRANIKPHADVPEAAMNVIKGLLTIDVQKRSELKDVRDNKFVREQVEKYNSNMSARVAAK
uniref:Aurora kinase n=1 Tax=Panagrellus redivivus TaxID=6233 RepID=A0A7E4V067_PANRE